MFRANSCVTSIARAPAARPAVAHHGLLALVTLRSSTAIAVAMRNAWPPKHPSQKTPLSPAWRQLLPYRERGNRQLPRHAPERKMDSAGSPCMKTFRLAQYSVTVFPIEIPARKVSHPTFRAFLARRIGRILLIDREDTPPNRHWDSPQLIPGDRWELHASPKTNFS